MSIRKKLLHELKIVGLVTLFFAVWYGLLIALKSLILAEYSIKFYGVSIALVGALVTAKVVIVLDHVPLGSIVSRCARIFEVLARTFLYTFGVLMALVIEKAVELRHESGGFFAAIQSVFSHRDMNHVWAATIGVGMGMLFYNSFSMLQRKLGANQLKDLFLSADAEKS